MAKMINKAPRMVTIGTVAKLMGVSVSTVRRLCNQYRLRFTWSNARRLFNEDEVMEDMIRLHEEKVAGQLS